MTASARERFSTSTTAAGAAPDAPMVRLTDFQKPTAKHWLTVKLRHWAIC